MTVPDEYMEVDVHSRLVQWERYCAGDDSINESEYAHFFTEEPTEAQVSQFLRSFLQHDALLARIHTHLVELNAPPPPFDEAALILAARRHVAVASASFFKIK